MNHLGALFDGPVQPRPRWSMARLGLVTLVVVAAAMTGEHLLAARHGSDSALRQRAEAAEEAFRRCALELAAARRARGLATVPGVPAERAGLVGSELTPLVTTLGSRETKLLASSPAWARVLTLRLGAAGVGSGDRVAASFSGSFPGLDLAVACACSALGARLDAVSSVTASTWGATDPGLTWPEMEVRLVRAGLMPAVSRAVSTGGARDRAADLTAEGRRLAVAIQEATASELGALCIRPRDLRDAIEQRMQVLGPSSRQGRVALYVSVGGNHASLGASAAVLRLSTGILRPGAFDLSPERGAVARFAEQDVPVLLLLNIQDLALRWGVQD